MCVCVCVCWDFLILFTAAFQGNNILNGLTSDQYESVLHMLENAILSTDLALYFKWASTNNNYYCSYWMIVTTMQLMEITA